VKKFLSTASIFLVGLLVCGNAAAYFVDGSEFVQGTDIREGSSGTPGAVAGGDYLGHIGNIHDGLPAAFRPASPDWNGTDINYVGGDTSSVSSYFPNSIKKLDPAGSVHWFKFSTGQAGFLNAYYEFDTGITEEFMVEFFKDDGSDTAAYTIDFATAFGPDFLTDNGHYQDDAFMHFDNGNWLMRITGLGTAPHNGYKVYVYPTAVPLPPVSCYSALPSPVSVLWDARGSNDWLPKNSI